MRQGNFYLETVEGLMLFAFLPSLVQKIRPKTDFSGFVLKLSLPVFLKRFLNLA